MVGLLCGVALCISRAQDEAPAIDHDRNSALSASSAQGRLKSGMDESRRKSERTLSSKDRRAVIASALHSKTLRYSEHDCSHLVHAVYQRAGLPYAYAPSDDLYEGVQGFQRVSRPQPADLVVWHGHVGIVIRPSRHAFFSVLHAGPGIDDYQNRYWRGRGRPRFYRYIKNTACAGCTLARGRASQ